MELIVFGGLALLVVLVFGIFFAIGSLEWRFRRRRARRERSEQRYSGVRWNGTRDERERQWRDVERKLGGHERRWRSGGRWR